MQKKIIIVLNNAVFMITGKGSIIMILGIIGGIIFIIMGVISLKNPVFVWKLQLYCNADEPSDWALQRIKFNGAGYILAGTAAFLYFLIQLIRRIW